MSKTGISFLKLAGGGITELLDYELSKLLENVRDPNTEAKKKRKITMTIEIAPDENQGHMTAKVDIKSSLAPVNGLQTYLYCSETEDGEIQAQELMAPGSDPNQGRLWEPGVDRETGEVLIQERHIEAVK